MAEEAEVSEAQMAEDVRRRDGEVTALLAKKDKVRALQVALQAPPTGSKDSKVKDDNAAIVERVLNTLADADIAPVVEGLDMEGCDVLMKYVYRLMSYSAPATPADRPLANCSLLLRLHAVLFDKAGQGAIVRSMTDRKQV